MADYRDWCPECHNEINFGGHDPDCDLMHAERIAYKEQREFEWAIRKEYDSKSEDELLDEAATLYKEIGDLGDVLAAKDRKWRFFRMEILTNRELKKKLAERLGVKYL